MNTGMGDRLWAGKQSQYVTTHSGQLSLAVPSWGTMSTIESCVNGHSTQCTSPVSSVSQQLLSDQDYRNQRHHRWLVCGSGRTLCILSTVDSRAFPVAAAQVWNGLLEAVVSSSSLQSFCRQLKTHLFNFHTLTWFLDRLTGIVIVVLVVMFII